MGGHWAFAACCALALTGCPTVDLGDNPPDIGLCNPAQGLAYFQSDIWPKYLHPSDVTKDCVKAGCHQLEHGLTLDATAPVDYARNYRVTQSYLNCGQPIASVLVTKPLAGIDAHGGGDLFADPSDPAVQTFLAWFQ